MVLGMFPSFMGMIAVYLLMTQFNLINHLWGLILIYAAGAPMGYLTQKGFFDTIPKAIDEAARIDGATNFQVFTRINLPLSKPIIVYTALPSFTWPWSDFILPKLLLKEKDLYREFDTLKCKKVPQSLEIGLFFCQIFIYII